MKVQLTDPINMSGPLPLPEVKCLLQIFGTFLFYGCVIDPTILMAQPVNLWDMNLLDLGFFHVVQSTNDEVARGDGEMIQHIQQTFACYPW